MKCVDCAKKDMGIMNMKIKLLKTKSGEKSTKLMLKIADVTCMLLDLTCVIATISLIFNQVK
jgi:hypothetical protein